MRGSLSPRCRRGGIGIGASEMKFMIPYFISQMALASSIALIHEDGGARRWWAIGLVLVVAITSRIAGEMYGKR